MKILFLSSIVAMLFVACSENKSNVIEEVSCDVENLSADSSEFISSFKLCSQVFKNGSAFSTKKARSGKGSVLLNETKQYGLTYKIYNVKPKEKYAIEVWRNSKDKSGNLIVQAKNAKELYLIENKSFETDEKGWDKVVINCIVPENLTNNELIIYLWNPSSTDSYFDDLTIKYVQNNN